jgi:hypothetical protein
MNLSRPLLAVVLAVSLTGCANFSLGNLFNSTAPATTQDALKAAQLTLTTYRDVYQVGLIAYLDLPHCPQAFLVACRDDTKVPKLLAVDKAATASIVAAQKVLEGNLTDTGQLAQMVQAVTAAETAIAGAGVALKGN